MSDIDYLALQANVICLLLLSWHRVDPRATGMVPLSREDRRGPVRRSRTTTEPPSFSFHERARLGKPSTRIQGLSRCNRNQSRDGPFRPRLQHASRHQHQGRNRLKQKRGPGLPEPLPFSHSLRLAGAFSL